MDPVALEKAFELYPEVRLVIVAHLYGTPGKMFLMITRWRRGVDTDSCDADILPHGAFLANKDNADHGTEANYVFAKSNKGKIR